MRRVLAAIITITLVLGITQCKKKINTVNASNNDGAVISLNVDGNSKVDVNPPDVVFEAGDVIYVVSEGRYVGQLIKQTDAEGGAFSGRVQGAVEGEPLYFYFLGNIEPVNRLELNATETSVVINDQASSLPVISYGHSFEFFSSELRNYTSELINKCALVKFNVTESVYTDFAAVCITGVNNKVNIDFTLKDDVSSFTYEQDGNGDITFVKRADNNYWAILLPQEALGAGESGTACCGRFNGSRPALPEIVANDYISTAISMTVTTPYVPSGAVSGLFSANQMYKVMFSKGNLKATTTDGWNSCTWSFMENQYSLVEDNAKPYCALNYADKTEVGLFAWGTSGYNHGANIYQPYSAGTVTDKTTYSSTNYNPYGTTTCLDLHSNDGRADWGYNHISNGGMDGYKQWRTLTDGEWGYIVGSTKTNRLSHGESTSGILYTKATIVVSGSESVKGLVVFPDDWSNDYYPVSSDYYNHPDCAFSNVTITLSEWESKLEAHGAVFLPAAGRRTMDSDNGDWDLTWVNQVNTDDNASGYYHSSKSTNGTNEVYLNFSGSTCTHNTKANNRRYYGFSVRLVCE